MEKENINQIIDAAIKQFNEWIDIYEEAFFNKENEEEKAYPIKLDINPFFPSLKNKKESSKKGLDDIEKLIRIKWCDALVAVQTPPLSSGKEKRTIRRAVIKKYKDKKYTNKKSIEAIANALSRLKPFKNVIG